MFKPDEAITLDGGTYRILKHLGKGGQVQAWKVARESDGAMFALRVVNPFDERTGRQIRRTPLALQSFNQRMRDETHFLKQLPDALAHNILPCLDSGTLDYQGVKLEAMLAPLMQDELSSYCPNLTHDPKPFNPEKLLLWLQQLATALAYVHQKDSNDTPHVHRDLKPSNVLMDADGNAFLTDFGILKAARSIGTTSVAFSDECCAPEQRLPLYLLEETENGKKKSKRQYHITPKADIYALGMVIHNLLLGNTKAQDDLAEDSAVDDHVREIPTLQTPPPTPLPIGDLGKLGGLRVAEQKALLKKLTTWLRPTLSSTGTFIPTDTVDTTPSLPDYPWLAERMTQLISQMLKPWPEHRPSATEVENEVALWQEALFPVLKNFTLQGNPTYAAGESMVFKLNCAGSGLLRGEHDFSWIQSYLGNALCHATKEVVDDLTCLPHFDNFTLALHLTGLKQGKHILRVEALVGGVLHEDQHEFQVEMSTQQLWDAGKHEQALQRELRPAWLEQQLAGLTSVSTAYAFMQMLERLKTTHPSQTDTLEAFRQRADQQFAAKSPVPKPAPVTGEEQPAVKKPVKLFEKQEPIIDPIDVKPPKPNWRRRIVGSVTLLAGLSVVWAVMPGKSTTKSEAELLENLRSKDATAREKAYTELAVLAEDPANSNAQQWMGYRYLMGDGVEKDLKTAKGWYKKAEAAGSSAAVLQLVEIDKALATAPK